MPLGSRGIGCAVVPYSSCGEPSRQGPGPSVPPALTARVKSFLLTFTMRLVVAVAVAVKREPVDPSTQDSRAGQAAAKLDIIIEMRGKKDGWNGVMDTSPTRQTTFL